MKTKALLISTLFVLSVSCSQSADPVQLLPSVEEEAFSLLSFSTDASTVIPATSSVYNKFLVTGDLDQDGLDDVVMGGIDHYQYLTKSPLLVLKNNGDGSVADMTANLVGLSPLEFYNPQGHIGDVNGDGKNDLVIFDWGPKTRAIDGGYMGGEPALFLSNLANNQLTYSSAISSAIATYRQSVLTGFSVPPLSCNGAKYYYKFHSEGDCDLFAVGDNELNNMSSGAIHSKYQSMGDVDGDGDLDIFVESGGGFGNYSYIVFLINDGSGNFSPSWDRISNVILKNEVGGQMGSWRHYDNEFVDIDGDGDQDLIMGKLGNAFNAFSFDHDILKSKVLINNGSGYFPDADVIELPNPAMLTGPSMQYATAASAVISVDLNADGLKDIVITHTRGTDGTNLGNTSWTSTGRFTQFIIQTSPLVFEDQTSDYIVDQSYFISENLRADYPSPYPQITFTNNRNGVKGMRYVDFDGDGDSDILFENVGHLDKERGNVGLINNNGKFKPFSIDEFQSPSVFYVTGAGLGWTDLNQDGKQDIVLSGPYESSDPSNIMSGVYLFIQ